MAQNAANDATIPAKDLALKGVEVREISLAEFMLEMHGQARLAVPTVRDIHRVPLRGPAYDFDLVPMEGGRQ